LAPSEQDCPKTLHNDLQFTVAGVCDPGLKEAGYNSIYSPVLTGAEINRRFCGWLPLERSDWTLIDDLPNFLLT